MKNFTRTELQDLRERAEILADVVPSIPWKRAYMELADSLDRLDAMIARCEVYGVVVTNG